MPRPRARSDGGRLQEFQQSASQCGRRIETPRGSSNSSVFGGSFARTFLTKLCNKMVALRSTISRHVSSGLVGIFVSTRTERKEIIKNRKYLCISLTGIPATCGVNVHRGGDIGGTHWHSGV